MKRREARKIAFELTYEMVVTGEFNPDTHDKLIYGDGDEREVDCDSVNFIDGVIDGIKQNYDKLKGLIVKYAKGYEYDRIYKVDLALILVGCYEILYTQTPRPVIVNEVVELAKEFSDVNSFSFINGILASVIKEADNGADN